ncbi:MAG: hypothetical protein DDT31_01672 [Syntrophomonadaceae bacterium]|nr:hypothetical protein [Bacillota bacterium]
MNSQNDIEKKDFIMLYSNYAAAQSRVDVANDNVKRARTAEEVKAALEEYTQAIAAASRFLSRRK